MFDQIKHSFKQTAIYSIGNLSTKVIGLVLLPLFTAYLTTEEYGVLALIEATSQILVGVLALNLPLAMLRWASAEKRIENQKSIIFTTIIAIIIIALFQLFLLMPNSKYFSELIFGKPDFSEYFFYLFIVIAFSIYNGIPLNIIRIKEKPIFFVVVSVIKFSLILLLNIYFIAVLRIGVLGIIFSQLVGEVFLTLITLPLVVKNTEAKFNILAFKEMIKYGLPLILSTVSTFAFSLGDRYLLKFYLNESSVGIYALGYKIASIINMLLLQSFQLGFLPIAYKKLGDEDESKFFSKILTYYSFLLVISALFISLFSKELLSLLAQNDEYIIAYTVVPIISFGFVLKGIQYTFALSFHYAKKTIYNAIIVFITAIINIGLNIVLIQSIGYLGAAYSMFVSILFMLVISYYFGKKVYYIPYELKKVFFVVITGVVFYLVSLIFKELQMTLSILLKGILLAFFPFILICGKFFDRTELNKLAELWNKRKNFKFNFLISKKK